MEASEVLAPEESYEDRMAKAKMSWIAGNGSLRELAEKYNLPSGAVFLRSSRDKWAEEAEKVEQNMIRSVSNEMAKKARKWVNETFERSDKWRKRIDDTVEQLLPAVDPMAVRALVQSEKIVDDLARRSLGLPDAPKQVDVTSGGLPLQESILQTLRVVGALKDQGKLDTTTIDVEALVNEPVEEE